MLNKLTDSDLTLDTGTTVIRPLKSVRDLGSGAALTGKHDTLVRRAPGWQGAPDGQQAKN